MKNDPIHFELKVLVFFVGVVKFLFKLDKSSNVSEVGRQKFFLR